MKKAKVKEIISRLRQAYPEAKCSLDFSNPFEILVAVLLSAQTTDERVNIVTKDLFKVASTPKDMNKLSLEEITEYIKTCGLYKTKAKNIKKLSKILVEDMNGEVPNDMKKLTSLPGIGRKSANVIMLEAFKNPIGIAVDTHVTRVCNRLGITKETDPLKIEEVLLKKLDKEDYFDASHLLIHYGRHVSKARGAIPEASPILDLDPYLSKLIKERDKKKKLKTKK